MIEIVRPGQRNKYCTIYRLRIGEIMREWQTGSFRDPVAKTQDLTGVNGTPLAKMQDSTGVTVTPVKQNTKSTGVTVTPVNDADIQSTGVTVTPITEEEIQKRNTELNTTTNKGLLLRGESEAFASASADPTVSEVAGPDTEVAAKAAPRRHCGGGGEKQEQDHQEPDEEENEVDAENENEDEDDGFDENEVYDMPLLILTCDGPCESIGIPESKICEWQDQFPTLDVLEECRAACERLDATPVTRKWLTSKESRDEVRAGLNPYFESMLKSLIDKPCWQAKRT